MRKFIFNGMNIGYTAPDRAQDVTYDNTSSGLSASNSQSAIDELTTTVNGKTNETTSFTEASTRENINSGDTVTTIWGKIKKFFSDLKTVAFTGSYNDLTNKPSLSTVATSGSYNDLSNKPSIPSTVADVTNFAFQSDSMGWGVQTGTVINSWENNGSAFGFRKDCPSSGKLSMVIDGTVYVDEGSYEVIHSGNIGSQSVSYSTSAGSATTAGSASDAGVLRLGTSGYQNNVINSWYQGNGWQGSPEDWGTFIVANNGDGTWYSQALLLPWHNNNIMYGRMQGGVFQGWANIVTNDNITSFEHNDHAIQTDVGESWDVNLFGAFAGTSDTTQRSEGLYKSARFIWNPYWCELYFRTAGSGMIGSAARQQMLFAASNETTYRLFLGVADNMWTLSPLNDGQLQLGSTSRRWGQIFSTNGAINTSDRNEKKDIEELDEFARTLIMSLKPCSYKFINGKSGRTHYGMIAQDIEESLDKLGITAMDLAAFCKDSKYTNTIVDKDTENEHVESTPIEGEYTYGLRYEEFIAPMIKTIQLQQNQIDKQQKQIDDLQKEINLLKEKS